MCVLFEVGLNIVKLVLLYDQFGMKIKYMLYCSYERLILVIIILFLKCVYNYDICFYLYCIKNLGDLKMLKLKFLVLYDISVNRLVNNDINMCIIC